MPVRGVAAGTLVELLSSFGDTTEKYSLPPKPQIPTTGLTVRQAFDKFGIL
jgi:hypothetical protein